jgi:hypothetical protein
LPDAYDIVSFTAYARGEPDSPFVERLLRLIHGVGYRYSVQSIPNQPTYRIGYQQRQDHGPDQMSPDPTILGVVVIHLSLSENRLIR